MTDRIYRTYKTTFESAHYIEGHPRCGNLHGHSYNLQVDFLGDGDKWKDFAELKQDVDGYIMLELDHQNLGNKSAEEISKNIGIKLEEMGYHGHLTLNETAKFGIVRDF
jgi:6-pyruvoyl-tetrahydropterin synthase